MRPPPGYLHSEMDQYPDEVGATWVTVVDIGSIISPEEQHRTVLSFPFIFWGAIDYLSGYTRTHLTRPTTTRCPPSRIARTNDGRYHDGEQPHVRVRFSSKPCGFVAASRSAQNEGSLFQSGGVAVFQSGGVAGWTAEVSTR